MPARIGTLKYLRNMLLCLVLGVIAFIQFVGDAIESVIGDDLDDQP